MVLLAVVPLLAPKRKRKSGLEGEALFVFDFALSPEKPRSRHRNADTGHESVHTIHQPACELLGNDSIVSLLENRRVRHKSQAGHATWLSKCYRASFHVK